MAFRVGIVISALLLLVAAQTNPSSHACTSFPDLSEPCGCILSHETFEPTCGTDGYTYLNACFLDCRKAIDKVDIRINYIGVCSKETRCTCHAGYAPICGSNGITYSNECLFNCFAKKDGSIRLKHNGECGSAVVQPLSDMTFKAKTGTFKCRPKLRRYYSRMSNNYHRSARSICWHRFREEQRLAKEALQTVQSVQPTSKPGQSPSYNNQIKKFNSRPNEGLVPKLNAVDSKKCACAAMHKPVCGNNHRTYANFCVLYCSSKKDPDVKFRHWGDCSNS